MEQTSFLLGKTLTRHFLMLPRKVGQRVYGRLTPYRPDTPSPRHLAWHPPLRLGNPIINYIRGVAWEYADIVPGKSDRYGCRV